MRNISKYREIEGYKETMWIRVTVFSSWACSKLTIKTLEQGVKYVIVNF